MIKFDCCNRMRFYASDAAEKFAIREWEVGGAAAIYPAESGDSLTINFCPFCGREIKVEFSPPLVFEFPFVPPSKFAYIWIDYDPPKQETYRAVEVKQVSNFDNKTVARFASGDPVNDYLCAAHFMQDNQFIIEWFPSNLVDWLSQGKGYTIIKDGSVIGFVAKP
jgi:hypothetical protein